MDLGGDNGDRAPLETYYRLRHRVIIVVMRSNSQLALVISAPALDAAAEIDCTGVLATGGDGYHVGG